MTLLKIYQTIIAGPTPSLPAQPSGIKWYTLSLTALDTTGNCQRPVFSLGVSQHMHKITNLWKFELNWSSKLRDKNERKKTHLVTQSCVLSDAWFRVSNSKSEVSKSKSWKITLFSKTSEGAFFHNVLYYQPLPTTRYQVRFYANNYFEQLPTVSTAFKLNVLQLQNWNDCPPPKKKKLYGSECPEGIFISNTHGGII